MYMQYVGIRGHFLVLEDEEPVRPKRETTLAPRRSSALRGADPQRLGGIRGHFLVLEDEEPVRPKRETTLAPRRSSAPREDNTNQCWKRGLSSVLISLGGWHVKYYKLSKAGRRIGDVACNLKSRYRLLAGVDSADIIKLKTKRVRARSKRVNEKNIGVAGINCVSLDDLTDFAQKGRSCWEKIHPPIVMLILPYAAISALTDPEALVNSSSLKTYF
uniref:Uncharacterized protein n=1 Tax=Glossina austeni TaxID=7395 RepID=A0A1A9VU69_GLOAU